MNVEKLLVKTYMSPCGWVSRRKWSWSTPPLCWWTASCRVFFTGQNLNVMNQMRPSPYCAALRVILMGRSFRPGECSRPPTELPVQFWFAFDVLKRELLSVTTGSRDRIKSECLNLKMAASKDVAFLPSRNLLSLSCGFYKLLIDLYTICYNRPTLGKTL